jgi:hypothetical protein
MNTATKQTNFQVNTDNQVNAEEVFNETAVSELFIKGIADFSNGEVDLYEAVVQAMVDERELVSTLLKRILTDELSAKSELRLLVGGIANQRNLAMA